MGGGNRVRLAGRDRRFGGGDGGLGDSVGLGGRGGGIEGVCGRLNGRDRRFGMRFGHFWVVLVRGASIVKRT
jgi:hypothetical protein